MLVLGSPASFSFDEGEGTQPLPLGRGDLYALAAPAAELRVRQGLPSPLMARNLGSPGREDRARTAVCARPLQRRCASNAKPLRAPP